MNKAKNVVAIVESSNFNNYLLASSFIHEALIAWNLVAEDTLFITAKKNSTDTIGKQFAENHNSVNSDNVIEIKPDWDREGKKAGFVRNMELIKLTKRFTPVGEQSKLIAFHKMEHNTNKLTYHTENIISLAIQKRFKTFIYYPDSVIDINFSNTTESIRENITEQMFIELFGGYSTRYDIE